MVGCHGNLSKTKQTELTNGVQQPYVPAVACTLAAKGASVGLHHMRVRPGHGDDQRYRVMKDEKFNKVEEDTRTKQCEPGWPTQLRLKILSALIRNGNRKHFTPMG